MKRYFHLGKGVMWLSTHVCVYGLDPYQFAWSVNIAAWHADPSLRVVNGLRYERHYDEASWHIQWETP